MSRLENQTGSLIKQIHLDVANNEKNKLTLTKVLQRRHSSITITLNYAKQYGLTLLCEIHSDKSLRLIR